MSKKITFLFVGLLVSFAIQAQTFFGDPNIIVSGGFDDIESIYASDLDGDGDMDVLSASSGDNKIAWYENMNNGELGPQIIISTEAEYAGSVFCADIDGDGDMDVLSASGGDDKIAWYENIDGEGNFGEQQIITTNADGARFVNAADLDGDGDMDVLSASYADDKIAWYENLDGNGSFSSEKIVTVTADQALAVYAVDLDGDNDLDLVTASRTDAKVAWYENTDGNGTFVSKQIITSNPTYILFFITILDCDGDGDQDIVTAIFNNEGGGDSHNDLSWHENTDGNGTFGPKIFIDDASTNNPKYLSCGDVTGDGNKDIILTRSNGGTYYYENTPFNSSKFSSLQLINNGNSIALSSDMDNDGDMDIIYSYSSSNIEKNKIGWSENLNGNGYFGAEIIGVGDPYTNYNILYTVDIDGDGDKDVVAGSTNTTLKWYENTGDGNYEFEHSIVSVSIYYYLRGSGYADMDEDGDVDIIYHSGNDIFWRENLDGNGYFANDHLISSSTALNRGLKVVDLDNDGDMDILGCSSDIGDKVVWIENINGNFGSDQIVMNISNPYRVITSDIDGDGDLDVVVRTFYKVVWAENFDGNGTFGSALTLDNSYYQDITSSDIDNDGDEDILAVHSSIGIELFENTNGFGTFVKKHIWDEATYPIRSTDMDNDGDLDIFCSSGNNQIWLKNNGAGMFSEEYSIGIRAINSCADDMDGDGDMDIFASYDEYNKHIIRYENLDGNGTFHSIRKVSTISGAKSAYIADLDGDGDLDMLSASENDNKTAWYENLDNLGSFGSQKLISTVGEGVNNIISADIDSDGNMDVLTTSYDDGIISWYRNLEGGSFGGQQIIENEDMTKKVQTGDMDGDGDLDVIGVYSTDSYSYSGAISWYENENGTGSFVKHFISSSSRPSTCFISDIDGDNDLDIVYGSENHQRIGWYENADGLGSFIHHYIGYTFYYPNVSASDIDGDGDIDVLACSKSNDKLVWYENTNGQGVFGVEQLISNLIDGPNSIYATDLDNDGDMDVLSASENDNKIVWFENTNGLGSFGTQQIISDSSDGACLVLANDLNDDSKMDVVSVSKNDNKIVWFENSPTLTIINQPFSQEICPNSNTSFSITVLNAQSYQWQLEDGSGFLDLDDGGVYSGTTASTLEISNATGAMSGYQYRCQVSDQVNTLISDTVTLTVDDFEDPVITSTHDDQSIDANAYCQAALPDFTGDVIAFDNCDINLTVTQFPAAMTFISGSTNEITLTVTDDAENFSQVFFNVEIIDNTEPVITSVHEDQTIGDGIVCEMGLPNYTGELTATDNCDTELEVTQSPEEGTFISNDINEVTLTATDDAGNFSEVTFNVEVVDNTEPEITSTHEDQIIYANEYCESILPNYIDDVIAIDNCDEELDIEQTPPYGLIISGSINEVTITVTDDDGNFTEVTFNVEVVDNISPEITSTHDDQTIEADDNCEAILPDYTGDVTATDNCDEDLDILQIPFPGSIISGSLYEITLTVTDDANNFSEVVFNLEKVDNTDPEIICIDDQSIDLPQGEITYAVQGTEFDPVSVEDNCIIGTVLNSFNNSATLSGAEFPIDTTIVIWTAIDEAGNDTECSFDVIVNAFVGIETFQQNGISIYPNPTTGIINFEFGDNNIQKIKISELTGKVIIEKTVIEQEETIDLSGFETGVYIISLQTDTEVMTTKIVKE